MKGGGTEGKNYIVDFNIMIWSEYKLLHVLKDVRLVLYEVNFYYMYLFLGTNAMFELNILCFNYDSNMEIIT